MFGGGADNPYDDIVAKATDENLTSENWEIILTLCDKVADEGQKGANNAVAALIKRLAHRNPNVQLYALSLAESLTKNLGVELHRELASKAFTQALEKVITDRTTHDKVKRRALQLVAECTAEFENDTSLGVMEDLYNSLKAKNYKFETAQEPLPPAVDDDIRRKEEEELQRVLEMSMQDRGGRSPWTDYSLASGSSSSAGASKPAAASSAKPASSSHGYSAPKYQAGYVPARTPSPATQQRHQQPDPKPEPHRQASYSAAQPSVVSAAATDTAPSTTAPRSPTTNANLNIVTRVRALHTFEPTEAGELAFEKGDVIKVVDRGYKDWWRGQLKGRTGIFPVNYVEPMPEPTATELAKEAEQEASVFSQAVNVERLLNMLRTMDPDKDNLADNEEIQELYRSCMSLRPKIVKLIDKYSQKRADLVSMNETFVRARTIFDRMMEESLARHTGVYEQQQPYRPSQYPQGQGRPNQRPQPAGPPQGYGWNPNVYGQPGYNAYPASASAYPIPQPQPQATPAPVQQPPYAQPQQPQIPAQAAPSPAPGPQPQLYGYSAPYSQQGPNPYGVQPQPQQQQQPQQQAQIQQPPVQQQQAQLQTQVQPLPSPFAQPAPAVQQAPQPQAVQSPPVHAQPSQLGFGQPQQAQPVQQQPQYANTQPPLQQTASANVVPQVQQQPQYANTQPPLQQTASANAVPQVQQQQQQQQPQAQPSQQQQSVQQVQHIQPLQQAQPQPQLQVETQPVQAQQQQPQPEPQPQPQPQQTQQPQEQPRTQQLQQQQASQAASGTAASLQSGPPYIYDPSTTYPDPNVQAWAQYYAQGGTDPAGAVYFVSVPGVSGPAPVAVASTPAITSSAGGPQRSQSFQAQQHQQQQRQQEQPQTSVISSTATRYQLTDTGFSPGGSASASAHQSQPQNPRQASDLSYVSASDGPTQGAPSSPPTNQGQAPSAATAPSASYSPQTQPSTPSWVLPKKGTGKA